MQRRYFLALGLVLFLSFAAAKSADILSAHVDVQINPNGSATISEQMDVDFSDTFTYGYRFIPIKNERITGVTAIVDGQNVKPAISIKEHNLYILYHFYARNEQKHIELHYLLSNSIKAYDDVADFYWKVWGDQWKIPVNSFSATVRLPKPVTNKSDFKRWGHPTLLGATITSDLQTANFNVPKVPAKQWVEVRAVFPVSLLDSTSAAVKMQGNGFDKILAEEIQAEQQNAFLSPMLVIWYIILLALFFLVPVAMIGLFYYIHKKYGIDPTVDYEQEYEHEPPYGYAPAYVSTLFNLSTKMPGPHDFTASILYLATKGFFKLQKIEIKKRNSRLFDSNKTGYRIVTDYRIVILDKDLSELPKHLRMVYRFIKRFATHSKKYGNKGIGMAKLVAKPSSSRSMQLKFYNFFEKWKKQVKSEAEKIGFFDSNKAQTIHSDIMGYVILLIILFSLLFILFLPLLFPLWPIFVYLAEIIVTDKILLATFKNALLRRTEKGTLHYKRWEAFKRFLNEFSDMKEYPPAHIILWEQYLVYGTTLGVAEKVLKAMKMVFTEPISDSRMLMDGDISSLDSISFVAITSALSNINTFSLPSSSGGDGGVTGSFIDYVVELAGGGGGGFSGGGGFGGGGGGGGFG